jgi:hypothetical protein
MMNIPKTEGLFRTKFTRRNVRRIASDNHQQAAVLAESHLIGCELAQVQYAFELWPVCDGIDQRRRPPPCRVPLAAARSRPTSSDV